jgi:hypothetical protein
VGQQEELDITESRMDEDPGDGGSALTRCPVGPNDTEIPMHDLPGSWGARIGGQATQSRQDGEKPERESLDE